MRFARASRSNRIRPLIAALSVAALLLAACGGDDETASEEDGESAADVEVEEDDEEAEEEDGGEDDDATDDDDAGDDDAGDDASGDKAGDESPYLEAAREEGEVTWYTAHYNLENAETIAELFEETYPDIKVNLYRQTAQRLNQRFLQEQEAGDTVADVLGITAISLIDSIAEQGLLAEFTPTNSDQIKSEYKKYDHPDGLYHVAALGNNVICYNTDEVSDDEAPTSWEDFLDPKWEGKIATGHPGASGYVGTWATWVYTEYGVEYLEQLSEQDVLVGQSITDTIPRLGAGERLVAACSDTTAAMAIGEGDPIQIIYPDDGAVIMPTPNAIPADAPHPNAARLLADFIVSEDAQRTLTEEQDLIPVIEGVDPPPHVPEDATYVRPDLEELTENLETVISEWRRLFGV